MNVDDDGDRRSRPRARCARRRGHGCTGRDRSRRCRTSAALVGPWNTRTDAGRLVRVARDLRGRRSRVSAMMMRTIALTMASLCRRNCASQRDPATARSARPARPRRRATSCGTTRPTAPWTAACSATSGFDWRSVKADPRVEPRVGRSARRLNTMTENDHDHHPRQDLRVVAVAGRRSRRSAPCPGTGRSLGDDETADDRADVDRGERRRAGSARCGTVAHDHPLLADALRRARCACSRSSSSRACRTACSGCRSRSPARRRRSPGGS